MNQVIRVNQNSVRRYVMNCGRCDCSLLNLDEASGEGIDPGARTDAALAAVQAGAVCIGAAGAKMVPLTPLHPKPQVFDDAAVKHVYPRTGQFVRTDSVVCAATHSVKILRNKRMVIARQGKPIHVDRAFVAGIGSQSESNPAPY